MPDISRPLNDDTLLDRRNVEKHAGRLQALSVLFTDAAEPLQAAADAILAQQDTIEELQRTVVELERTTRQEKPLAIYIDNTYSTTITASYGDEMSPLEKALNAVHTLLLAGVNAKTHFWGGDILRQVEITTNIDIERLAKAGGNTTDFEPVVKFLETRTTASPDNIVIVSDGDLPGDDADYMARIADVLRANKQTTLDFVVLSNDRSINNMSKVARFLRSQFPDQVSHRVVQSDESATDALASIARSRSYLAKAPQATRYLGRQGPTCGSF